MSDEIDLAQERDAMLLDAQRAYRKPEGPKPNGKCYTCEEPVPVPRRWCDAACRDDYDRSFLSQRR